ncbi:methyl-accepting chemotaxis protein [Actinoplanes sp. NPDC049265]|uniref:methyl-accepting chemotaxis protein n=1 Tax=Actinoplanes sp. NPDC049265 TaxID=3363902 RepID=UPI0037110437
MTGAATTLPAGAGRRRGVLTRLIADRRIGTKINAAVSLMALVATAVGVLAIVRMAQMSEAADDLYQMGVRPIQEIDKVKLDMDVTRRNVLNFAISRSPENQAKYEKAIAANDASFAADLKSYRDLTRESVAADQLAAAWTEYQKLRDSDLMPAARARDFDAFEKARDTITQPAADKASAVARQLSERANADASARRQKAADAYHSSRTAIIVMLAVGVIGALTVGVLIARAIVTGVRKVSQVVAGLAACDLTGHVRPDSRDELGQMGADLDTAVSSVRSTVGNLAETATALSGAATQLSKLSGELSGGAEEASGKASAAATSAERISTSVQTVAAGAEEMTASIREIAATSSQAAEVANESLSLARDTSGRLAELGRASTEIGDVVRLITSIAEQTNLLALNATIEAARAGDAGKGFAVVASEVKDLAQETARATEDITGRIGAIQSSSGGASTAVERIETVIGQITDYSTTIASAVEEQSATTNEMTRSISDAASSSNEVLASFAAVAEVTTATSGSARASRDAADHLSDLSIKLNGLVAQFRY